MTEISKLFAGTKAGKIYERELEIMGKELERMGIRAIRTKRSTVYAGLTRVDLRDDQGREYRLEVWTADDNRPYMELEYLYGRDRWVTAGVIWYGKDLHMDLLAAMMGKELAWSTTVPDGPILVVGSILDNIGGSL